MTIIRKELVRALTSEAETERENGELRARIAKMEKEHAKEIAGMAAKLAFYESPNMPTSKPSFFNEERDKFRKSRGEKIGGSPGERSGKSPKDGGGPSGEKSGKRSQDGEGSSGEGSGESSSGGSRRGPPVGHKGISHCNKPSKIVEYPAERCPKCGGTDLKQNMPVRKQVADFDGNQRTITVATAVIGNATCNSCGGRIRGPNPFTDGTSFGPILLGLVVHMHNMACTDDDISGLLEGFCRFYVSSSAVWNARKALARKLGPQIESIKKEFLRWSWVQLDEAVVKTGRGQGYAWTATVPGATFVYVAPSRTDVVLHEHFSWLAGKAVVCDGYQAYSTEIGGKKMFPWKQRCLRHLLAKMEALAVRERQRREEAGESGPGPLELIYDRMLAMYRKIRHMETLAPFTTMSLSRLAWQIVSEYGEQGEEGKVRGHVMRAILDMFTFAAFPGMPPHNNAAEIEIRDVVVCQRVVRGKLVTPEGREVFSILVTFSRTCHKRGLFPCRAVVELSRDPEWDVIHPERAQLEPANPDWSALTRSSKNLAPAVA